MESKEVKGKEKNKYSSRKKTKQGSKQKSLNNVIRVRQCVNQS
jgi:hypothetical protein